MAAKKLSTLRAEAELPFSFSSYVLLNPLGGSANPLGLMSHQAALARQLLPQFTVLTSKPRYHALLCASILALSDLGRQVTPQSVRECEILWGLSQTAVNRAEPDEVVVPLNVRRYHSILNDLEERGERATLEAAKHKGYRLMDYINYGVWGFYINPSREWRLVDESLRKLRPLGETLGRAFSNGTGYSEILRKWLNGRAISNSDLLAFGEVAALNQIPEKEERTAWSHVLKAFLKDFEKHHPEQTAVWDILPNRQASTKNDTLASVLEAQDHFDASANWLEFLFEVAYLKAESSSRVELKKVDQDFLHEQCVSALRDYRRAKSNFSAEPLLFGSALNAKNYAELQRNLLSAHNAVQLRKNKSPYISSEGRLIQSNALNCERAIKIFDSLEKKSLSDLKKQMHEVYHRDWHFPRAEAYKESFT